MKPLTEPQNYKVEDGNIPHYILLLLPLPTLDGEEKYENHRQYHYPRLGRSTKPRLHPQGRTLSAWYLLRGKFRLAAGRSDHPSRSTDWIVDLFLRPGIYAITKARHRTDRRSGWNCTDPSDCRRERGGGEGGEVKKGEYSAKYTLYWVLRGKEIVWFLWFSNQTINEITVC